MSRQPIIRLTDTKQRGNSKSSSTPVRRSVYYIQQTRLKSINHIIQKPPMIKSLNCGLISYLLINTYTYIMLQKQFIP